MANNIGFRVSDTTAVTMIREPVYVYALAFLIKIFKSDLLVAQLLNYIFAVFSSAVIFKLSGVIGFSKKAQYYASILYLIHPVVVWFEHKGWR